MFTSILIIVTIVLFVPYSILMLLYKKWFSKLKIFIPAQNYTANTFFSIIIPARNEEENIANCLNSILKQNYPDNLYEIIVVDDYSNDDTAAIVNSFCSQYQNIRLISLQNELQGKPLNAYKKKAIEIAIEKSVGNWIITTDADCIVLPNWLKNLNDFIVEKQMVFIAAPVIFLKEKTIISQFQYIDFMALQAATAATVSVGLHSMCNGANLAYQKSTFYEVGGFKGIDNIASGDDMLLMNKIKQRYKNKIGYLFSKDSIVTTQPMPNWSSFINQRVRWASKADKYDDKSLLPVLLMVYLFNLSLFVMALVAIFNPVLLISFVVIGFFKTLVEWLFIKPASAFFGSTSLAIFGMLQPIHIAYIVIAGWLGKFGTYKWKDRNVK